MTTPTLLPQGFTGPANKYTQWMDPLDNVGLRTTFTKPTATQMLAADSQRALSVSGPNPGFSVTQRQSTIQPGGNSISNASHIPPEVHWERFETQYEAPTAAIADISGMSRADFIQYREQKDRNPNKVPRAPNVVQSNSCATCKFPESNIFGCNKDPIYYTQHPDYRDMNTFPKPQQPGWFGFKQEQLDRHNTAQFWNSKRHT